MTTTFSTVLTETQFPNLLEWYVHVRLVIERFSKICSAYKLTPTEKHQKQQQIERQDIITDPTNQTQSQPTHFC